MNWLTTLAQLFSRGLESVASFFLSGRGKATSIEEALNTHLVISQGQVTTAAARDLLSSVQRAEIAGDIVSQIGRVERRTVPRAPGMNFRDPYTGEIGAYRYHVVIIPEEGSGGFPASTYVYSPTGISRDEIIRQGLEQLAEHTAFLESIPGGLSDDVIATGRYRVEIKSVYRRT